MQIGAITIPDNAADDVLAAMEKRWRGDAEGLVPGYENLPVRQKIRACLMAQIRVTTKNYRREAAERAAAVSVPDVDVT